MLLLNKLYRKDYAGEDIIAERKYENGKWSAVTEHVPNNIINNQISDRAVIFGNGIHRDAIDINHILTHKSGLLGADTMQSYACNAFYRDYTPDFLVITDRRIAKEVVDSGFNENNISYTRVDISLEFPKKFYLVPHDPYADAGTTAIYLAAFDGHKKIYMIGFDGQDEQGTNNNIYAGTNGYDPINFAVDEKKWNENQKTVFNVYNDIDFVLVTLHGRERIPEDWNYCSNLRQISHRDFVLEADL
jgi:hypothetical protein